MVSKDNIFAVLANCGPFDAVYISPELWCYFSNINKRSHCFFNVLNCLTTPKSIDDCMRQVDETASHILSTGRICIISGNAFIRGCLYKWASSLLATISEFKSFSPDTIMISLYQNHQLETVQTSDARVLAYSSPVPLVLKYCTPSYRPQAPPQVVSEGYWARVTMFNG